MRGRELLAAKVETHAGDDEIDRFAARDDEELVDIGCPYVAADPPPARWGRPLSSLADDVRALASVPIWSWGFPTLDRYAETPAGSLIYLIGATGRGKSSFLAQVATHHARAAGPVLIVSAELTTAIFAARIVAQAVPGASWLDVCRGNVDDAAILSALDVPRLNIVDRPDADWPTRLRAEIAAMKAEHPGCTPLVCLDYLQLLRTEGRDPRERTAAASTILRSAASETGAVILAIARAAREASKAMRSGRMAGVDATEAAGESGQVEYDANVQVTLGAMAPLDEADPTGAQIVDISVAKTRMGAADVVIPFRFDGARGVFSEHGEGVPSSQRKADAAAAQKRDKATSNATDRATAIARRRIVALLLARDAKGVTIGAYRGAVLGSGGTCGGTTAGEDLSWLDSVGLLAWPDDGDTQQGRLLTDAGRAVLGGPDPAARLAELARTKAGAA